METVGKKFKSKFTLTLFGGQVYAVHRIYCFWPILTDSV